MVCVTDQVTLIDRATTSICCWSPQRLQQFSAVAACTHGQESSSATHCVLFNCADATLRYGIPLCREAACPESQYCC
eukprot:6213987-Pleurochrysis_carterae.AAC.1